MVVVKKCTKCGEIKDESKFYFDKRRSSPYSQCKTCHNAITARWSKEHPEERRAYLYDYNRSEKVKEKERARYNTPADKEKARKWRHSPGARLVRQAKYYRRRARLQNAASNLTKQEWENTLKSYGGKCVYCGGDGTTIDHVVPIARGGSHSVNNVVPACPTCNSSKNAKPLLLWMLQKCQR